MGIWNVLCLLLIAVASIYDWFISVKRILKFGPEIELNPIVRWLISWLGIKKGLFLGIFPGAICAGVLFSVLSLPRLLGFFTGIKAAYFVLQLTAGKLFES